ncbi:MAG: hypothetical protein HBSIN02_25510 [Bacteroidia bacterium]|nr:MAG: hypothetical protein HBSIN02_25510 [Bacteroidia bacterium]
MRLKNGDSGQLPSKWTSHVIVFLLGLRLVLSQFRDVAFFDIDSYHVSILTFWSALFAFMVIWRLALPPKVNAVLRRTVVLILLFVVIFGITRIFAPTEIITSFLYMVLFFLALLVAGKLFHDLPIEKLIKPILFFGGVLLTMHATAPLWGSLGQVEESLGGYIGAFPSKQMAGATFSALFPFVFFRYAERRNLQSFFFLVAVSVFLFLTFQRTAIVGTGIFLTAFLYYTKRLPYVLPAVVIFVAIICYLPEEELSRFVQTKIVKEVEAAEGGEIGALGAGRVRVAILAVEWLSSQMNLMEILFGLGTAQSNMLHFLAVGHYAYAHVQAVAVLIDYGIIGGSLIIVLLVQLFKIKRRQLREHNRLADVIGMAVLVVLIAQMFYAMPLQDGATGVLLVFWLYACVQTPRLPQNSSSSN